MSDGRLDNIMADRSKTDQDDISVVADVLSDNGEFIGVQCVNEVNNNSLTDVDLLFYFDMSFPVDDVNNEDEVLAAQEKALQYVREESLRQVAKKWGISDGSTCQTPPLDVRSSWMVQIVSGTADFSHVDVFETCRELSTTDPCFVYEAKMTASLFGVAKEIPDVVKYIEEQFNGPILANTEYASKFLAVPVQDPGSPEEDRSNLGEPSNLRTEEQEAGPNGRQTITMVGSFLIAAFCLAFIGLAFVLYRRRQAYLDSIQQMHHNLSKESDLQNYDTDPHNSDDISGGDPQDSIGEPDNFPNNITFDLGNTFKDQLMGVHGFGGPKRPPMNAAPYGASVDGASDSDADSWAQTDGTIGSLELQLEPITAEV